MNSKGNNQLSPKQIFTYLEFGSIDSHKGNKEVYDFRVNEKAYDWLMHARYSNDIFAYKQMTDALKAGNIDDIIYLFKSEIHHENDFIFNLNKKIALDISGGSFLELGQTLFGCIDTIEFINRLEKFLLPHLGKANSLENVNWFGLDISPFFNFMAKKMHKEYKVNTGTVLTDLSENYDVFFAKGITLLYAINSANELFNFVSKAKISVIDYSVSLGEQEDSYIGTGKSVRFLSQNEFDSFYQMILNSGKDIWVRGNSKPDFEKNRMYIEGIITDEIHAQSFIKKQRDWVLTMQNKEPKLFDALVHNKDPEYWTWSKLSDSYK
tara:strand:+ start:14189 stop:15157 length:969 start_codon:yes stop_codon:yes gene_type:complete